MFPAASDYITARTNLQDSGQDHWPRGCKFNGGK